MKNINFYYILTGILIKGIRMKIFTILLVLVSMLFGAVDINSANQEKLSSLSGIGLKKADAIIEYRKINCFNNIYELVEVKGIGSKTVEKNRDNLTVGKCKN